MAAENKRYDGLIHGAASMAGLVDAGRQMLDDVAELLRPGALRERMARVPSYYPRRGPLAERAAMTASRLEADRAMALFVAEQLISLRASPLGRWLCPAPGPGPGARISLAETVRQRGAVLFSLDRAAHGRDADVIANLVARDTAAVYAGYRRAAISGDGLCWFSQCETIDQAALAELAAAGAGTGLTSLLTTTSPPAAGRLADQVNVLVLHRLDDPALADRLGWLAGRRLVPAPRAPAGRSTAVTGWPEAGDAPAGQDGRAPQVSAAPPRGTSWRPAVAGDALRALGDGEFTLITRGTAGARGRLVPLALRVPARIRGGRGWPP